MHLVTNEEYVFAQFTLFLLHNIPVLYMRLTSVGYMLERYHLIYYSYYLDECALR